VTKPPARIAYEAALRGAKKGRGRFQVAPKEERTVDGRVFDSKREATRYAELKVLERAGKISHLECQPEFPVTINGHLLCRVHFDFAYFENGERIIEDVKSKDGRGTAKDTAYRLRKRAAELFFYIKVREV
jgi:hypothetical protein